MSLSPVGDPDGVVAAAAADSVVRLDIAGNDRAQQAALGSGTQHNYFGSASAAAEAAVSIAPPAGQRDQRYPLRGRSNLVRDLLMVGTEAPGVRVMHGMGGCGKTSLALEVAYHVQQRGVEVWWVSAANEPRLLAGMRALSRRLGVTDDELRHGEAADLLWRRLAGWEHEWLLVIDNADDPQILAGPGASMADGTGWLRPVSARAGLVLVTSRDGRAASWGSWCRLYPVTTLAAGEAAQVLADRVGEHHDALGGDADAEALAQRLGRLPLALRIAGAFLAEQASVPLAFADPDVVRSYCQYQEVLDAGHLDSEFPTSEAGGLTPGQARGLIGRTWDLTLDLLESRRFPEARKLLRLLACMADAPIPYELLLYPPALAGSAPFAGITGPRLWQVLQALAGFGLIDLTSSEDRAAPGVIRLHPLVRDTSRPIDCDELMTYLKLAASLVHRAAAPQGVGSPEDPATWPLWQKLAPHALRVLDALVTAPGYAEDAMISATYAASVTASYQAALGLVSSAEETLRTILKFRLATFGADHPETIDTRYAIAQRLAERADYTQAEAEYRAVLKARLTALGPEHADTLSTQHNMAALISFRGDYARAEAEYRQVLAIKLHVLGEDHPDYLYTRHEVARMMAERGKTAEAETEFRAVLAGRLRTLGGDHPHTLITRSQIARAVAAQGHHARAEAEYRDIFAVQVKLLGPEHPRTLWTRHEIGRMMAAQGNHAGAESEYRQVLSARTRRLPEHPETLVTRHEIARMMAAQGDLKQAEAEFRSVLAAKKRVLGLKHPSTALTAQELESLVSGTGGTSTRTGVVGAE